MKFFPNKTVFYCFLFTLCVCSWPFIQFPLTDGDIVNWSKISYQISQSKQFFSTAADQGHGPLMAWGGALSLLCFGPSFLGLNLLNLLCGLFCVFLVYHLSKLFFKNEVSAGIAVFIHSTIIASIYLTRTPMYDWPATAAYLGFVYWYSKYITKDNIKDLFISLVCIGIGSLSRFSICLGLAGIYVILSNLILRRSLLLLIRDGVFVVLAIGLANSYWLVQQMHTQGESFLKTFLYDNTGRYVKSTRPNAVFKADFYAFPLIVLVGFLPYSFALIASFFQKGIVQRIRDNSAYQLILAAFLPCLLLFTFSGHTKLARYIAYVFPFIAILLADFLVNFDLKRAEFRQKCARFIGVTAILVSLLLLQQGIQFFKEVQESWLFTGAIIVFLYGLLYLGYLLLCKRHNEWMEKPEQFLIGFGLVYILFFSVLSFEYTRAPFLESVRVGVYDSVTQP